MPKTKLLLALAFLFLPILAHAQGGPGQSNYPASVNINSGAPSGTCPGTNAFLVDISTPNLYYCPVQGAAWVKGSGSGSGTVNNCTAAGLAYYSASGTTVSCDTSATDNGSGVISASFLGSLGITAASAAKITALTLSTSLATTSAGHILFSSVAPTIVTGGCGGTGASISSNNGTSSFRVNVGTSNTGTCTITMPTSTTGWNCSANDLTTKSTAVSQTQQTSASTQTSLVLQNYTDLTAAGAWTDSDTLNVTCGGN
jgi:hypothetical protein